MLITKKPIIKDLALIICIFDYVSEKLISHCNFIDNIKNEKTVKSLSF